MILSLTERAVRLIVVIFSALHTGLVAQFAWEGSRMRQLSVNPRVAYSNIFLFIDAFLNPNSFCHTRQIAMKLVFTKHVQKD